MSLLLSDHGFLFFFNAVPSFSPDGFFPPLPYNLFLLRPRSGVFFSWKRPAFIILLFSRRLDFGISPDNLFFSQVSDVVSMFFSFSLFYGFSRELVPLLIFSHDDVSSRVPIALSGPSALCHLPFVPACALLSPFTSS